MKSLSNLIFKTKSNAIMFDRDFIVKIMQQKSKHLRGIVLGKRRVGGKERWRNCVCIFPGGAHFLLPLILRWNPYQTWFLKRNRTESWLIGVSSQKWCTQKKVNIWGVFVCVKDKNWRYQYYHNNPSKNHLPMSYYLIVVLMLP